jgi:clan AA aspartic protease
MGEVRASVVLANARDIYQGKPDGQVRRTTVDALVDTGAVMVLLPQDLVEALGIPFTWKAIVSLANEERIELDVAGPIEFTIAGRTWTTDCLVGPPNSEALIGQLVLERLDLVIDSLKQTLTTRPESPYLPSLKLK